jgi:1-aminocyclopropane-1-carboxylate deaminase/D-cysteine desulfhydrase-like pyridoxal-dependent ACC family enzyme
MLAPGYGLLNDATVAAISYLARSEGILLDPTYSGKTFAVLLAMLQRGDFSADDDVVFLHTGGAASLFAYPELVAEVGEAR